MPITRAKHFPLSMQRRPLQPPAAADPPPAPANDEPPASALGITVALIAGAAIVAGVVFLAASSKVRGQRQQYVTRIDRIPSRAAASRPMSWHSTMAQTLIAQCTSLSWAMSSTSLQSAKCMRPEQAMDSSPARLVACLVLLKYHNKRQPTTGCILRLFDGFEYIAYQQKSHTATPIIAGKFKAEDYEREHPPHDVSVLSATQLAAVDDWRTFYHGRYP